MPYRLDTTPAYADLPEQISVKVVAAYPGVSPQAIYQQIMRGSLPATRSGRTIRVARDALPVPVVVAGKRVWSGREFVHHS